MEPLPFMLLRSGLFHGLAADRFAALLGGVTLVDVHAGERVFAEGDPADAFYVVVSGALEVYTTAEDASEIVLARLAPGAHLGEQAVLDARAARRMASARGVAERSVVARFQAGVLDELCAHTPALRDHLARLGAGWRAERRARRTELVRRLEGRGAELARPDGHVLYREGDPADSVFVVLAGRVELYVDRDGVPARVAVLEAGLCVGERDEATRGATAITDGPTRLLEVPRATFRDLAADAGVRAHLDALMQASTLPQRGFVRRYLDDHDGVPVVAQRFGLADDHAVVASFGLHDGTARLRAARGRPARTVANPDGSVRVAVADDGRICGIEARRDAPALPPLFARAIERAPLSAAEEASLAAGADLDLARDDGPLCACMRVSRATVRAAVQGGCHDLPGVQARTGCGTACGTCVPSVLELLGEAAYTPVVVTRVEELTPDVRRIHLARVDRGTLPAARPGQHVVLRARVAGRRIERPYTLSGAAGDPWEITVRRAPGGVFSGWLFERAVKGLALEASSPRGEYVWDGGPAPIVCFVAGIGVTPALSFARTLLREGWPHRMVIDWSTRHDDGAILGELAGPLPSNLTLTRRVTGRAGRLAAADVRAHVTRFPSAEFYLCGPADYLRDVAAWLAEAGVPARRVHVERFTAVGAPTQPTTARGQIELAPHPEAVRPRPHRLRRLVDAVQAWAGA